MRPRVSVLMAVHNGEEYLRGAVDSILSQTFTDFEFIIVDDGSIDRSGEIISTYNDPRIRLIRHDDNLGLAASLNKGLGLARGEYVARMDCDDVSLPERLAKQVAFMDAHPEVGACSTWALDIDREGNIIGKRDTLTGEPLDNFYWRTSLIHPASIIRFSRLSNLRYDGELHCSQDYDLWFKIRAQAKLSNIPEYLFLYRVHDKSVSATKAGKQIRTAYDIFCKHLSTRKISYQEFLALMGRSNDLNPVRRAMATMKLARIIHKPYRVFLMDDLDYMQDWLRSRRIYKAVTYASRITHYMRRKISSHM